MHDLVLIAWLFLHFMFALTAVVALVWGTLYAIRWVNITRRRYRRRKAARV